METLEVFEDNKPWKDRVARLLIVALPNNTDGVLRKEIRKWRYTEALQYHQHILLLNNLLHIMNRNKVEDRQLIEWTQQAMYDTGRAEVQAIRTKWIEHKSAPENNARDWTFAQAIDYILAMEAAARENGSQSLFSVEDANDDRNPPNQGGGRGNKGNKGKNANDEKKTQDQGRKGKTPEEKWGDQCPNQRCNRREHGKANMDRHLKDCRYKTKATQTNFTTLKETRCCALKIVREEYDYIPVMPMTIVKKTEGTKKRTVAKSTPRVETLVFFDTGSKKLLINKVYAHELVTEKGFTSRKGQRYRVNGVDESGDGIICDSYIDLYFLMNDTPILQCALIVAGLPERLIAGRETMKTLSLTLAHGPEKEENFLKSVKYGLFHQIEGKAERKEKSLREAESFLASIREEKAKSTHEPSMFQQLDTEDLKEVFEVVRRVTFDI
jgi:hypothetical protein